MLEISLSEQLRSRLCQLLAVILLIVALLGNLIGGIAGFIEISAIKYTEIVEGYDGQAFFILLLVTGVWVTLTHFIGGIFLFMMSDPSRRTNRLIMLMQAFTFALLLAMILEIVGGVLCFTHISHLHDSFKEGITLAMGQYAYQGHIKEDIDRLQMDFQCCGNDHYQDWFHHKWQLPEFSVIPGSNRTIAADSVPFSCCNPAAERDCITAAIHQNDRHIQYDYKSDLTVYKVGCREALMDYFGDQVLVNSGSIILGMFGLEIVLVVLVRLLQTSIAAAIESGDPTATSTGYLCGRSKGDGDGPPLPTKSAIDRRSLFGPDDFGDGALSVYGSDRDIMAARASSKHRPSVLAGIHARVSQLSQRNDSSGSGYLRMGSPNRSKGSVRSGYLHSGEDDKGLYSAGSVPGFNPPSIPGRIPAPPPPPPLRN